MDYATYINLYAVNVRKLTVLVLILKCVVNIRVLFLMYILFGGERERGRET